MEHYEDDSKESLFSAGLYTPGVLWLNCFEELTKRECRICLDGENESDLISPCKCSGTCKYIHRSCLLLAINYYDQKQSTSKAMRSCTICGEPYLFKLQCPNLQQYIHHKLRTTTVDTINVTLLKVFRHLLQPCHHAFLCLMIKMLAAICIGVFALFLGRLEMWLVSAETSWEEFIESFKGTLDNVLILLTALATHFGILISIVTITRLVMLNKKIKHQRGGMNSANMNLKRKLLADLKAIVGTTLFSSSVSIGIFFSAIKVRVLLRVLFSVPFETFAIHWGTGTNFFNNVVMGTTMLIIDTFVVMSCKWIYQDWEVFKRANTTRVLCY